MNTVTNATRQRILDEQIAMVLHLPWDDFREMLQDSTHVAGASVCAAAMLIDNGNARGIEDKKVPMADKKLRRSA